MASRVWWMAAFKWPQNKRVRLMPHRRRRLIRDKGQIEAFHAGGDAKAFSSLQIERLKRQRIVRAADKNGAAAANAQLQRSLRSTYSPASAPRPSVRVSATTPQTSSPGPLMLILAPSLLSFTDVMLRPGALRLVFVNAVDRLIFDQNRYAVPNK